MASDKLIELVKKTPKESVKDTSNAELPKWANYDDTLTSAPISTKYDTDGKLILDGYVMTGNIVTVSKARLGNKILNLTLSEMKIVEDEIIKSQGMKKRFDTLTNIISDKDTYIEKLKEKNTVQEELLEQLKINIDEQKRAIEELKKSSITEVG